MKIDMTLKLALLASALTVSACASIVDGSQQSLSVKTIGKGHDVENASCQLTNNKGTWFANSPGSVTVHRSYDPLNVKCAKAGWPAGIVTVESHTKGMAFGNILAGGIIGGAVDMSTGAAYDYPSLITVEMGVSKVETPPAKQSTPANPQATKPST